MFPAIDLETLKAQCTVEDYRKVDAFINDCFAAVGGRGAAGGAY